MSKNYDFVTKVVVIGAGPAGSSAALFLAKEKIEHILLDKSVFPRDKICGDGLTQKVSHVLNKLDGGEILKDMGENLSIFRKNPGLSVVSPDGIFLPVRLQGYEEERKHPPLWSIRRIDFDHYLHSTLNKNYTTFFQNATVTDIKHVDNGVEILFEEDGKVKTLFASILIGADGDRSVVKKKLAPQKMNPRHYCAGIRCYYKNIKPSAHPDLIEFHFIKTLPYGYFWIFPLADGSANVGLGMLSKKVSQMKVNLREELHKIIASNPHLQIRFAEAQMEDKIMGWGLPMGSKIGILSGNNFMLTGDAASLIDPVSGEGIGNAMYSAMLAAEACTKLLADNDFSASNMAKYYDVRVKRTMLPELKMSSFFQKLYAFPRLITFLIKNTERNKTFRHLIHLLCVDYIEFKRRLFNPITYFKIIWDFF